MSSDEVPVADAIDQQREAVEPVPDDEAPEPDTGGPPLEATPADWQEQSETVDTGSEDVDREI